MEFSEEQKIYINFLMEQLNFEVENFDHEFNVKYIEYLEKATGKFKNIANCERKEFIYNGTKNFIPKDGLTTITYKDNGDFFEALNISLIQFLQLEYRIKKKKLYNIFPYITNTISATDISNFTFCPVSFSISKSINYLTLETTAEGRKLHDKSILMELVENLKPNVNNIEKGSNLIYDDSYINLSESLKGFEILYAGHNKLFKEIKFESANGKYVGKPDYILINRKENKIIVVEEKFYQIPTEIHNYGNKTKYAELAKNVNRKRNRKRFHENHINQILSYIYGIKDYKIDYGLLVYWKYEYDQSGNTHVTKCHFKKIDRNDKVREKLNTIFKDIQTFKSKGSRDFNPDLRNPKKCANCVYNYLCGHKTGKFDYITYPYEEKFIETKTVILPELFQTSLKNNKKLMTYEEKLLEQVIETKNLLNKI